MSALDKNIPDLDYINLMGMDGSELLEFYQAGTNVRITVGDLFGVFLQVTGWSMIPSNGNPYSVLQIDSSGTGIFSDSVLFDNSGVDSVHLTDRSLLDENRYVSQNYNDRILYDGAANPSFNYGSRNFYDPTGNLSMSSGARQLYDDSGALSITFGTGNKRLYYSSGNIMLDFEIGYAFDSSDIPAINIPQRYTIDNMGLPSVDWQNRDLYNSTGDVLMSFYNGVQFHTAAAWGFSGVSPTVTSTGWTLASSWTPLKTFPDTSTVSLNDLANLVQTLIGEMLSKGLLKS